jgi:hypothetical protein
MYYTPAALLAKYVITKQNKPTQCTSCPAILVSSAATLHTAPVVYKWISKMCNIVLYKKIAQQQPKKV